MNRLQNGKHHRSVANCQKKVPYRTLAIALRMAARVAAKRGHRGLRAYRCPHCDKWHLTHKPRQPAAHAQNDAR